MEDKRTMRHAPSRVKYQLTDNRQASRSQTRAATKIAPRTSTKSPPSGAMTDQRVERSGVIRSPPFRGMASSRRQAHQRTSGALCSTGQKRTRQREPLRRHAYVGRCRLRRHSCRSAAIAPDPASRLARIVGDCRRSFLVFEITLEFPFPCAGLEPPSGVDGRITATWAVLCVQTETGASTTTRAGGAGGG